MSVRRAVLLLLAALAVAATALCCWLVASPTTDSGAAPTIDKQGSYRAGSLPREEDEAAVSAAAAALVPALSYDYRHLTSDLAAATKLMTPGFAAQFRKTFHKTAAVLAPQQHAVTKALVRGAALVRRSGHAARCLVFVDQVRVDSTTAKSQPVLTPSRVLLSLRRSDGRWLVAGISPF